MGRSEAGRLEVFALAGADAAKLQQVIKDKLFLASYVFIDTGPQDSATQKLAMDQAGLVIVVQSSAWGSKNATKVLRAVVAKGYPKTPLVVVNNLDDKPAKESDGFVSIPEIHGLQGTLLSRSSGMAAQYADRLLDLIDDELPERDEDSWPGAVVAVVGGKGGVGKSTVAALLAIRAAEQGGVAALLDLDCQEGNLSTVVAKSRLDQGGHVRWRKNEELLPRGHNT